MRTSRSSESQCVAATNLSALALAPIRNGDKLIMPYKERLYPWVLVRLLPKMQRLTVGQFRTRSDAEGHLDILHRLIPGVKFAVIFKPELLQAQQADTCDRTFDR